MTKAKQTKANLKKKKKSNHVLNIFVLALW